MNHEMGDRDNVGEFISKRGQVGDLALDFAQMLPRDQIYPSLLIISRCRHMEIGHCSLFGLTCFSPIQLGFDVT
ncbi:hypothetical protein PY365_27110 [Roseiarcaceae bacterium H3SJ34-1]|nr:hypothetical protein [Roseiarcaceae bacterium H3SJ34-1]